MANTMKALQTVTVGAGGTSSISFTNIPQTYTDLVIKVSARSTRASDEDGLAVGLNGSGSTFWLLLSANGSTVVSGTSTSLGYGAGFTGRIPAANATSSSFGNAELYIPNYVAANVKALTSDAVTETNGSTAYMSLLGNYYSGTTPITSITISASNANLAQYSSFTLYGVFNQDVSTVPSAPTIGTAVAGYQSASVAFTEVSGAASYTATSTPGSFTSTGATSPITVSGLTNGTDYTFKVKANNPIGSSAESSASNSVTPVNAFSSIGTATGNGSASTITLSGISQEYTHLQVRYWSKSVWAPGTVAEPLRMQFNGDATTGAYYFRTVWNGASSVSYSSGNFTAFGDTFLPTASNLPANVGGTGVMDILNYTSSSIKKQVSAIGGVDSSNYYTGNAWGVAFTSGFWNNTSPITSISFITASGAAWTSDTYFAVYGIKVS